MKNKLLEFKEKGLTFLQSLKTKLKKIDLSKIGRKNSKKRRKNKPRPISGQSLLISYWESRQPLIPYLSSPFLVDF